MSDRVTIVLLALAALAAGCARKPESSAPAASSPTPSVTAGRKVLYWYDPMVPGSKFDKPGKSPFMDMELVPMYADEAAAGAASEPSAALVRLSPEAVRASGIAIAPVERASLGRTIRTVGTIEPDETRLTRVAARVAGRIEKLYADYTGQTVAAGALLYALYSPELVATQRELLLALENRRRLAGGTPEAVRSADELVAAARDRLRLWSVAPGEIATIESSGQPLYAVAFSSPRRGTVLEKKVVVGQYVTEGQELYLLADLSTVWLLAQVYEHELSRLSVGLPAEATVAALPGRTFRGRVAFVDPVLDRETRSARVRIELANARGELKPGMFGDAHLETGATPSLVIPRSALIDTGARRVVYVETAPNTFQARDVRIGEASRDKVAVLAGLEEGERVVAAANFFIDSQAQLSSGSSIQWSGALDVPKTPEPRP
jgi:membrane fusion protein, copper/silver efflux system